VLRPFLFWCHYEPFVALRTGSAKQSLDVFQKSFDEIRTLRLTGSGNPSPGGKILTRMKLCKALESRMSLSLFKPSEGSEPSEGFF
jgi:hypothetical protein